MFHLQFLKINEDMDGTNYLRADNDVIRVFIYSIKSFEIRIFHLYINIR